MLLQKQLPAFSSVPTSLASGVTSTVTCKIDPGFRYHVIWLAFGNDGTTNPGQGLGTLAANGMVAEIRVKIGGKTQRQHTAVELNELNKLMNTPGTTTYTAKTSGTAGVSGYRTYIPIFLAEPFRKGSIVTKNGDVVPESELGAWNHDGKKEITIEVDLIGRTSAGANGVLDTPVIGGFFEYDGIQGALGQIVKFRRFSSGSTANPQEIRDLDRVGGAYQAISLFTTSDHKYVTSLMFTRNNEQLRQDVTRYQNDAILISRGMNPTALDTASNTTKDNTGAFHLVFDYDDSVRNFLPVAGVSELTLKPTLDGASAGTLTMIAQVVGEPD